MTAVVVAPAARSTTAVAIRAVLALVQAIILRVDLIRVRVEPPAVAPLAAAAMLTEAASPAGAAWTEFAESARASALVVEVTPWREKYLRNLSSARSTRLAEASSLAPRAAPTSRKLLP